MKNQVKSLENAISILAGVVDNIDCKFDRKVPDNTRHMDILEDICQVRFKLMMVLNKIVKVGGQDEKQNNNKKLQRQRRESRRLLKEDEGGVCDNE